MHHVITYASRVYVTIETDLRVFHLSQRFSPDYHKNLQQDHCSPICHALMMITGIIETFAICRLLSFSLAVIFIIRLFSISAFRLPTYPSTM